MKEGKKCDKSSKHNHNKLLLSFQGINHSDAMTAVATQGCTNFENYTKSFMGTGSNQFYDKCRTGTWKAEMISKVWPLNRPGCNHKKKNHTMRTYEKYPSWGKNHLHKFCFLHNYKTNPGQQMVLEDYREGSTMATCRITLRTQKLLKTTFYISKLQQLLLNKEQRICSFLTVKVAC
jgi:hypothetical protein